MSLRSYLTLIAVYTLPYLILLVPVQFSGEVYVFDGLIRGDCGRSPITEYASLWTLFFYVPTWLMALFLASHCALGGPSSRAVTVLTLACLPYLGDMGAVWASASTSFVLDPLSPQLNLLLLNPLNKYHPFLLYSALALSLHLTLSYSRLLTNVGYSLPFGMGEGGTKSLRNLTSGFIVSALYAGSWWALQEGTWGGWWNWDPSEVLGLLILLPLIFCWHQRGRPVSESMNSYRFGLGAWCTGVAYVLIQLNFEAVSHNFGIQLFFFFYNDTYYYVLLTTLFSFIIGSGPRFWWNVRTLWLLGGSADTLQVPDLRFWLQKVTTVLIGAASVVVIFFTATTILTPSLRWGGADLSNWFLKFNIVFGLALAVFYNPTLKGVAWVWVNVSSGLMWQLLPHWAGWAVRAYQPFVIHFGLWTFFILNTYLIDTPTHRWSGGLSLITPTTHLRLDSVSYTLQGELVVRSYLNLGAVSCAWLGAPTVLFQVNNYTPAAFFLNCSNVAQFNYYLLTDSSCLEFLELETTYLLNPALVLALLAVSWHFRP